MLPILTCDGCGVCCDQQGSPPFAGEDLIRLARERPDLHAAYLASIMSDPWRYDDGKPCLWYADGRCQHYEHRPDICRDFEHGQEDCLRMRAERTIPSRNGTSDLPG